MLTRYWTTTGRRFEPSLCSGAVPLQGYDRNTTGELRSEIIQMLLEVQRSELAVKGISL